MSLRTYKTLGKSGLRVSLLCLGTMTFGEDWGFGTDPKQSGEILSRYMELGGNFIDTANIYNNGHSEKIIGDLVGREPSKRDRLVIGTKFGNNFYRGDPNGGGNGTKAIIKSCEDSLRRLQTDYIDLYWIHHWDWNTPAEETMKTLNNLVNSGKVRYIGISYAPAWKIAQVQTMAYFREWAPFIGLQIEYSLLERTIEDELVPMAQELGLGITPWSPLRGGLLSGKFNRDNSGETAGSRGEISGLAAQLGEREYGIIDRLTQLAGAHHSTPAAIAIAWVISRPGVTSTIIGARKIEQLEINISALDVQLSADELSSLDQLSVPPPTFVTANVEPTRMFQHGGINVNGYTPMELPLTPKSDEDRY